MYKIGNKLKCEVTISGNYNFTLGNIYEIATQRQQDKMYVIFDENNIASYFDEKDLTACFKIVNDKDLNKSNNLKNKKASHYNLWLDTDSIDIIKAFLTKEEYIGALKFNILKYQLRLGKKDNVDSEKQKIKDYQNELNFLINKKSKNNASR